MIMALSKIVLLLIFTLFCEINSMITNIKLHFEDDNIRPESPTFQVVHDEFSKRPSNVSYLFYGERGSSCTSVAATCMHGYFKILAV